MMDASIPNTSTPSSSTTTSKHTITLVNTSIPLPNQSQFLQSLPSLAENYENNEEINLTNLRITKMVTFNNCPVVKKIVLRQNAITYIERVECSNTLLELDLYENSIENIENISHLFKLVYLDLSFNNIRVIKNLDGPISKSLKELYLINNKITDINGLENLQVLRLFELGSNRIRVIENLDKLNMLEELWLGKNKITQGLENLVNLTRISLQSNRLIELNDGFRLNINLQELYLSHNGLISMKGIETLINLRIVDFGTNQIKKLEGVENLKKLNELWINHNLLENWEDLSILTNKPLTTVYFEGNPLAKDVDYREKMLALFPNLEQLDWEELKR